MSNKNPNRPAPLVIYNEHGKGTRFNVAWMPQQIKTPDSNRGVLRFIGDHDEKFSLINMQTGRIGKEQTRFISARVNIDFASYSETFKALHCKTIRVMTPEQAEAVDQAYGAMQAKIAAAREEYKAILAATWKAARNLKQAEVDPDMREDKDESQ
jgi:hypothetical protein